MMFARDDFWKLENEAWLLEQFLAGIVTALPKGRSVYASDAMVRAAQLRSGITKLSVKALQGQIEIVGKGEQTT